MSDAARNVEILKEAYSRWRDTRGKSADHWMSICAPNIRFGSLARGMEKAEYLTAYDNRDALAAYFEGLGRDWEMLEYVAENFVAEGDRVVMLGRCAYRHKGTGKVVTTPKADAWRFEGDKVIEFYEYYDTAQVGAACC
jgi:ketosteroid isomerase-like protein